MAIAKMKKLTLLAEHAHKEDVLKRVQEMQSLEVTSLADKDDEDLLKEFIRETPVSKTQDLQGKLQDIEYAIDYLDDYVIQPGLIEKLKSKRDVYTLSELETHVEAANIDTSLDLVSVKEQEINTLGEELKRLKQEEQFLRKWRGLNFMPNEVDRFNLMHIMIGTVDIEHAEPLIDTLKENGKIYYEEVYRRSDEVAYLFILPKDDVETLTDSISQYSFQELNYDYEMLPEDALYRNLLEQKEKRETLADHKKEMEGWKSVYKDLQLAEEYYYNLSERNKAKDILVDSPHLFMLTGWIEEEKVEELKSSINLAVGENDVVILTDEIKMEEYRDVPIVLKNNKLIQPFEMITEMFSYPQYNEVDPTPYMFPFFLIFFGMIGADLGYGLILWVATFGALKYFNIEGSTKRFLKFLYILSYPTMAFGLFFGSFFGIELPIQVLSLQDDVIEIMIISVAIGIFQLVFGLIMNGIIKGRQGQRASSYIDGYAWAMMLVGVVLYVLGSMVWDVSLLSQIGIGLALLNVVGILVVSTISSKNKGLGFGLGLYNLYGVSGYIGDIVSYTRLMALGVASANIAMAFNLIIGFLPPLIRFTVGVVLIIALQALNIALAFLSAYVHSSRLQYVEFFGKFFEGGGKPLLPLRTLEKHIWLKKEANYKMEE
ncbi:V/A-type H+-transporting ATPase subunit I [Alkalibacterium putridalgicola]|uniref:V-type ATP synthase subunit I n=1 Tax=Alkalibacterium putridalgicola TaxID=426703 RepID=A0A1H7Q4V5_9LACT|nr:V-type ATP synthase subunit I [Alkalibacterium putridalgicola]GEK88036.1 V-type ATP synthase subunit I [Alkalibacterium putridalgicola]SEL43120.1 V/A-type H+-transporting ATPase subunit I [Alkalibacterium putridalgicola]